MKLKLQFIILLLSILLSFYSCKEKCGTIHEYPKEFTDYWLFDKGSWWIYKLENQDVYDTALVTNVIEEITGPETPEEEDPCNRHYYVYLKHSSEFFYGIQYSGIQSIGSYTKFAKDIDYYISGVLSSRSVIYLLYPFYFNTERNDVTTLDTSLMINNNFYTDVVLTIDYNNHSYFLVKNIGFARYEFADSTVWNLVDFNVKPYK